MHPQVLVPRVVYPFTFVFVAVLSLSCIQGVIAQHVSVPLLITGADADGPPALLHMGIDPAATDGIDPDLESELPPFSPGFEARFTGDGLELGSRSDYRSGALGSSTTATHVVDVQWGTSTDITFEWSFPPFVTGVLRDPSGMLLTVDMQGRGTYTETQSSRDRFEIELTYTPPAPPTPFAYAATFVGVLAQDTYRLGGSNINLTFAGMIGSGPVSVTFEPFSASSEESAEILTLLQGVSEVPDLQPQDIRISPYTWQVLVGETLAFDEATVHFTLKGRDGGDCLEGGGGILGVCEGREGLVNIVQRDGPGQPFELAAQQDASEGDPDPGTYDGADGLDAAVTRLGEFIFVGVAPGLGGNPLPVELTAIEAVRSESRVWLVWETASEVNNAGFEIQYRQNGGFVPVGFVAGHGTTDLRHRYEHAIGPLAPGRHTFRLKQIDYDGTFAYSPEVEVVVEVTNDVMLEPVYPNPFNPVTTVRFAVREAQTVTVALYDMLGRRLRTLHHGGVPAHELQTIRIDADDLASGMYVVRLQGSRFTASERVLLAK